MKTIIALEDLIRVGENRIALARKQLSDHEAGELKLSRMVRASIEETLVKHTELVQKHKNMLKELLSQDIAELEEKERIKEAIKRKNYFHYQKVRLKRDITKTNDQKIEAMMILDELPESINIEDRELFEIATKSLELYLPLHMIIEEDLKKIKKDFEELTKNLAGENIRELQMLNYQIPIIILQFYTLLLNIKENIQEDDLPPFKGFPRFEDWWIDELWSSHQAYFGLYKWKEIVKNLCITTDQKKAWDIIFSNWLFVKKLINSKGALAYEYNFAFDALMRKYAELEEELEEDNLNYMKKIIEKLTQKEDFLSVKKNHSVTTSYLKFKIDKLKEKQKK